MSKTSTLPDRIPKSEFVARRLSLAFCNTVALPDAEDRLLDIPHLKAWAERAGHPLNDLPTGAQLQAFHDLRHHLRAIFATLADGMPPPPDALAALGQMARPLPLAWDNSAYRAVPVPSSGDSVAQLHQALVADAIDLLTSNAVSRVKRCPAEDCRWFFLDISRNATRRWCAMSDCGVRNKVQRYRDRQMPF